MKSKKIIAALSACLMASAIIANPAMATSKSSNLSNASNSSNSSNASNASKAEKVAVKLEKVAKPAEIKMLKGADLVNIIADKKQKDATLIIDVRDNKEYKEGHILNAINIPSTEIESRLAEIADMKDKAVVVYCNSGKKSHDAAQILVNYGFTNVSDAEGVKKFTYELVKYDNIRGEAFKKLIDTKADVQIIDIRPFKDLANAMIKGAKHIPLDELQGRLAEISKDKMVIVYCNTGTKSVEAAKILNEAGYNVTNVIEGTKEFQYDLVPAN